MPERMFDGVSKGKKFPKKLQRKKYKEQSEKFVKKLSHDY